MVAPSPAFTLVPPPPGLVGLADGGVQVNGQGPVAGSRPGLPSPGQQLAAHPVELTDVAPPEAAQEGAQGGWRLDRAAQGAGRPPGAQHIGVVNADATSVIILSLVFARPGASPRSRRCRTSSGRPRCRARVAGRSSPALATKRRSSKVIWIRSGWLRGSIYSVLLFRGRFFATKPLSQKHRSTFLPPQDANPTPSFGGFGFRRASPPRRHLDTGGGLLRVACIPGRIPATAGWPSQFSTWGRV